MYPTMFSINFHHGGHFTHLPNRRYENGKLNVVDLFDTGRFSIEELESVKNEFGYMNGVPTYYHFRLPDGDLDSGLHVLLNESDCLQLTEYVPRGIRFFDVYVEHGDTNVQEVMRIAYSADNESIDEQQDENVFDYADMNEFQPFVNDNQQMSETESEEEEDSDYTEDEEDKCDEDNRNYKVNIDDDEVHPELNAMDYLLVLDNDDFDSGCESDENIGSIRKRKLKHLRRAHGDDKSFYTGRAKSDVLLNNMCEVFNSKILDGRDKPIITALEYIRDYLMRRIVNVLEVIDKTEGPLTLTAKTQFDKIMKDATNYIVTWNGGDKYQVAGPFDQVVVDINQKTCTCRRWEITGMPCRHGVAAIWKAQVGTPESFVDPVHKLETWKKVYNFKVFPLPGKSEWPKSQIPTTITPPIHHKQVGRPKKKRKKSEVEGIDKGGRLSKKNSTVTCSKCKNKGHNKSTCKGQPFEG